MPFPRWLRPGARSARTFRPNLVPLEDRTVPAALIGVIDHPAPGPATHLQVIVPEHVQAGQTFEVKVAALDASNRIATSFAESISLSSGDTTATGTATKGSALTALPLSYTFQASDHGVHTFQLQLTATGAETIKATDTATNTSVTGDTESTNVNPAAVASKIVVVTPEAAATGVATRVEVEVLDQSGHLMKNFTGTVTVTSADTSATAAPNRHTAAASVPITYTFTAADHGEHTFLVTFNATAAATGTATTVTTSTTVGTATLSGQGSVTLYPPTTVTHLGVFTAPFAVAGSAVPVEVVALNASNQAVTGYTGTVTLTSGDSAATASTTRGGPAAALSGAGLSYTFTAGDAGKHTFYVMFNTTGGETLTVTDNSTPTVLKNTRTVQVILPHHGRWFV
jgi:hypothetical protein